MQDSDRHYEAVVVGGGAAGLSGAVVLARARRRVLVVDAGRPRNARADGVHSYLSRDGVRPAELLAVGREELRGYGGEFREGEVARIDREDDRFTVSLGDGARVSADRLLVTTGLVDELPPVPGLAERFGRDVLHCPYCHGWEVRDEPIVVLATGPAVVHQALLWRQWSETVTVLRHTAPPFDAVDLERLAARGITVVDDEAAAMEVEDDRLVGVALADGSTVACRAVAVAPVFTASGAVLAGLGLRASDMTLQGRVVGTYIESDQTGATSVPGVWVAGNVTNPMAQVVSAAEAGARAAAAINLDLIEAEVERAVAERRLALTL